MKTLLLLTTAALLPSCTVTVSESGAKSVTVEGASVLKALEIIATK